MQKRLEQNSDYRQRPHDSEQRPTQRAPNTNERERSISSRDQQVDRRMIEDPQDPFNFRNVETVIESRGKVYRDKTAAEHSRRHNMPGCSVPAGNNHQHNESSNTRSQPDSMSNAVGDLLAYMTSPGLPLTFHAEL